MADSLDTLRKELFAALQSYDNQKVSDVLEKMNAEQVNVKNRWGQTALHGAISRKNNRAVTLLLNKLGIDVNVKSDKSGATPLHMACTYFNHEAVAQLLERPDIQLNARSDGSTPIMAAARLCSKEALKLLLASPRVDVNLRDNEGRGLEELVGLSPVIGEQRKKQCLDMIKEERLKRENGGEVEKQIKVKEGRMIAIERIEKINQEIEDVQQRSKDEGDIRKLKRKNLDERHNAEREKFLKKQRDEKSEMEEKFTKEDEANEKLVTSLEDERQKLAKDIVKISSGPSHDACNDDKANLEAARETLECLVCLETMEPPTKIWACPNGHALCEPCKENLVHQKGGPHPPCPTCKTEKINQRALIVEKIAASLFHKNK